MTPQSQIIEVAKLDGKDNLLNKILIAWANNNPLLQQRLREEGLDYLHSRDAIIGVIEKQPDSIKHDICVILCGNSDLRKNWESKDMRTILLATPAQLTEALLRAVGKWEE